MSYVLTSNTPPPIVIHLDSSSAGIKQLETDKTTNFIYSLTEPVIIPDHMNMLISLHTATIPYSFYNVRSGVNNQLDISIDGSDISSLVLDEGNYSANGLKNLIKTHMELEASITTFDISYTRETLKFKIFFTGSATSVVFKSSSSCLDLLGFTSAGKTFTGKTIGNAVKSDKAVDLNDAIHGLYLRQNLATRGTLDTAQGIFSNILARIPITTNAGGIIFYTPSSNQHETMISVPLIQTIGIRITDDKHRTIDLNGLHFQLSIKLSYIHKEKLREGVPRLNRQMIKTIVGEEEKLKIKQTKRRSKKK